MGKAALLGAFSCSPRDCRQLCLPPAWPMHMASQTNAVISPPSSVVDKTFTNSAREKCSHLYYHVVKLDISGAIGVHESQKEVKIQMDINVH